LGDEFTTGSSMLPQKKNSDVAELARAKSGRLVGNLTGLLVTLKGLPLSYNRDLQEDKEPLFDSLRQVHLVLAALTGAYGSLTFHDDVASLAAGDSSLVAIDIADQLVREGVAFRQAHARVGQVVGDAVRRGVPLVDAVSQDPELARFSTLFEPGSSLAHRSSPGASGPIPAGAQRERLDESLNALRARLSNGELETS
jgi:argininosuccinate lyase